LAGDVEADILHVDLDDFLDRWHDLWMDVLHVEVSCLIIVSLHDLTIDLLDLLSDALEVIVERLETFVVFFVSQSLQISFGYGSDDLDEKIH